MTEYSVAARTLRLLKRFPGYRFGWREIQLLMECDRVSAYDAVRRLQRNPNIQAINKRVPHRISRREVTEIWYDPKLKT